MEKEELVNQLNLVQENAPDTNYKYERALTLLVGRNFTHSVAEDARTILEGYIHQNDEKRKIAYSAFYCLVIFYRHQFNNKALDELWENYAKIYANFSDSSFFNDFNNYDNLNDYRSLGHLYLLRFLSNLNTTDNDDFLFVVFDNRFNFCYEVFCIQFGSKQHLTKYKYK